MCVLSILLFLSTATSFLPRLLLSQPFHALSSTHTLATSTTLSILLTALANPDWGEDSVAEGHAGPFWLVVLVASSTLLAASTLSQSALWVLVSASTALLTPPPPPPPPLLSPTSQGGPGRPGRSSSRGRSAVRSVSLGERRRHDGGVGGGEGMINVSNSSNRFPGTDSLLPRLEWRMNCCVAPRSWGAWRKGVVARVERVYGGGNGEGVWAAIVGRDLLERVGPAGWGMAGVFVLAAWLVVFSAPSGWDSERSWVWMLPLGGVLWVLGLGGLWGAGVALSSVGGRGVETPSRGERVRVWRRVYCLALLPLLQGLALCSALLLLASLHQWIKCGWHPVAGLCSLLLVLGLWALVLFPFTLALAGAAVLGCSPDAPSTFPSVALSLSSSSLAQTGDSNRILPLPPLILGSSSPPGPRSASGVSPRLRRDFVSRKVVFQAVLDIVGAPETAFDVLERCSVLHGTGTHSLAGSDDRLWNASTGSLKESQLTSMAMSQPIVGSRSGSRSHRSRGGGGVSHDSRSSHSSRDPARSLSVSKVLASQGGGKRRARRHTLEPGAGLLSEGSVSRSGYGDSVVVSDHEFARQLSSQLERIAASEEESIVSSRSFTPKAVSETRQRGRRLSMIEAASPMRVPLPPVTHDGLDVDAASRSPRKRRISVTGPFRHGSKPGSPLRNAVSGSELSNTMSNTLEEDLGESRRHSDSEGGEASSSLSSSSSSSSTSSGVSSSFQSPPTLSRVQSNDVEAMPATFEDQEEHKLSLPDPPMAFPFSRQASVGGTKASLEAEAAVAKRALPFSRNVTHEKFSSGPPPAFGDIPHVDIHSHSEDEEDDVSSSGLAGGGSGVSPFSRQDTLDDMAGLVPVVEPKGLFSRGNSRRESCSDED